jgi:Uma2 family endonuclease
MEMLVVDPRVSARLIEERRARGQDHFDEVWEGTYIMAPAPNDEHQEISLHLALPFVAVVEETGVGKVRPTINLALDPNDWENDYRIPDLAVFLTSSLAVCHGTFWCGPPDFLVEIVSPWDKTRDKINFYSQLGTRELLIIDRDPWQLELLRHKSNKLSHFATVTLGDAEAVTSEVLPMRFRLVPGDPRPKIEVFATQLSRTWTV